MKPVWLYPTDTIYALGVSAFDPEALALLAQIKGRPVTQSVSCLVRDADDIARLATINSTAQKLITAFLPGALTIILPATDARLQHVSTDGTVSFRITPDQAAKRTIAEFMDLYNAPLTCTSANLHGQPPQSQPAAILHQLGEQAAHVTKVIDDGPRTGTASTVVRCVTDEVEIIRVGAISEAAITAVVSV